MSLVNQRTAFVAVLVFVIVTSVVVEFTGSKPVHAENISCGTEPTVRCDATLVNTDADTGYALAVTVIGYDDDGDVVTRYTNDATGSSDGIASVPAGGTENITITTSASEPVADAIVRVTSVDPVES